MRAGDSLDAVFHVASDCDVSLAEVFVGLLIDYEQGDRVKVGLDLGRYFLVAELVDVDPVHLQDAVAIAESGCRGWRPCVHGADVVSRPAVTGVDVEAETTVVVPSVDDTEPGTVRVDLIRLCTSICMICTSNNNSIVLKL